MTGVQTCALPISPVDGGDVDAGIEMGGGEEDEDDGDGIEDDEDDGAELVDCVVGGAAAVGGGLDGSLAQSSLSLFSRACLPSRARNDVNSYGTPALCSAFAHGRGGAASAEDVNGDSQDDDDGTGAAGGGGGGTGPPGALDDEDAIVGELGEGRWLGGGSDGRAGDRPGVDGRRGRARLGW